MPDEIIEEKPVETPVPASIGGDEFQMPEKFQGKSAEEIAKSTVELERKLTELTANDGSKAEIAKLTKQITKLQEAILSKNQPPVEEDVAAQNTKKYLNDLGYVNKEDLAKAQEQGRKEYELSRMNADLAKKYDGKDGKPVYNGQEIASYAQVNGLSSLPPETVYELKHKAELLDWNIKQALKGNRAPSVPGQGKGSQQPAGPDLSKLKGEELEKVVRENAIARISAQE